MATQGSREELLSLLLATDFLSFHILDEMLQVFADVITKEGPESSSFPLLVAVTTHCVQEMLARPDECATSGSKRPFSAWFTITDPLFAPERGEAWSLASALETLLCQQLASKSSKSARLYVATLKFAPEVLIERVIAQRSHTHIDMTEHPCLIRQLVECDPSRFAPALAELLFDENVPEKVVVLWSSGIFDSAVLEVAQRKSVFQDMESRGQLLANGIVRRTCSVVHSMVCLFCFTGTRCQFSPTQISHLDNNASA